MTQLSRTVETMIVVAALILVLLVSLGAVILFANKNDEVSADVLPAVLTSVLGYPVGLIHPSPVSQN